MCVDQRISSLEDLRCLIPVDAELFEVNIKLEEDFLPVLQSAAEGGIYFFSTAALMMDSSAPALTISAREYSLSPDKYSSGFICSVIL